VQVDEERLQWADDHQERSGGGGGCGNKLQKLLC